MQISLYRSHSLSNPLMATTKPSRPNRPRSLSSIFGWARAGDVRPLEPRHIPATIVSLSTPSPEQEREPQLSERQLLQSNLEILRFFPFTFFWFYFPKSNVNNPQLKKEAAWLLKDSMLFCTLNKSLLLPWVVFGREGACQASPSKHCYILFLFLLFLIKTCWRFTHTHLDKSP